MISHKFLMVLQPAEFIEPSITVIAFKPLLDDNSIVNNYVLLLEDNISSIMALGK